MWTPDNLSQLIRDFSERRKAEQARLKRQGRQAGAETMEPRIMLSMSQAVHAAAPDTQQFVSVAQGTPAVGKSIVFIDAEAGEVSLPTGSDVVRLEPSSDAIGQITAELAKRKDLTSVHMVSHGSAGELRLAGRDVTRQDLFNHADELRKWAGSLAMNAAIDLYGCDVAAGSSGKSFVDALAKLTGATVAASTDPTGPASLGGDSMLEYIAGDTSDVRSILSAEDFSQLLVATYTITPSGGATTHVVGGGATTIDAAITVTAASGTSSTATVAIASGYRSGEDTLAATFAGVTTGFSAGTLTLTAGVAKTAAEWQAVFRVVTFATATTTPNLSARGITFTIGADTSASKSVTPDLPVDEAMQTRIIESLGVLESIGTKIAALSGTPGKDDATEVPFTGGLKVTDLLYPMKADLDSNGNPQTDYGTSVQPQGIGAYLALHDAAQTYLDGVGLITDTSGLVTALQNRLAAIVPGTSATRSVGIVFTKPAASDVRSLAITITIANTRGADIDLSLPDLERDLGMHLPTPPTITVGGGADIAVTITLDLQGHTYGGALTQNKATVAFTRLNSLAGFSFDSVTTTAEFGLIRGQLVGASGIVGAKIPVTFTGGGASRALDTWLADATLVTGFGTLTGTASLNLPITAGIGGVLATTANTEVVVTDTNIFDDIAPAYTTTDFSKLLYFGTLKVEDVIQQVLKVGNLFDALTHSDEGLFGLQTPLLKNTTLGDLLDYSSLFKSAIGSQIDIYEPVLNTAGSDALTDYRLPISDDTTPKPAAWSDLRAGFTFGIVVNNTFPVHTITIAADNTRNTLDDLVTDVNAALTTAGVDIVASNTSSKLSFKASDVSVQKFALVPVAPPAGRLSPTTPPADLSASLADGATAYYTVTGTTSGSVTGTNYYTLATPIAAAAVHAGILTSGQSGVVKVTRVGSVSSLWGQTRHGVTSADGSGQAYLIESGENDLKRLGVVPLDTAFRVLEQYSDGRIRASIPLAADLTSAAMITVTSGSTNYYVTVADSNRTSIVDTLADVNAGLLAAGVATTDLRAQLVDSSGNVLSGTPVNGTDYYLEFFTPTGSTFSTFSLAPVSDLTAYQVLPLGFTSGDVSAQPRPEALRTFEDFSNATLFPNLTVTPVYDSATNSVTLKFSASTTSTPTIAAGFDFSPKPLGRVTATNTGLTFTPSVASNLAFSLVFQVKPSKPITIASGASIPTNGILSSDAHFDLDLVLQDKFAITVPSSWTTSNTGVQDLIADINRALKQAVPTAGGTTDLTTDRLIARRQLDGNQFEIVTATPTNGGAAIALTHTAGVLTSDFSYNFTHDGIVYNLSLPAASTSANTSFADLVLELNDALSTVTVVSSGTTFSLAGKVFFTTLADTSGVSDSNVYLYATSPASSSWPSTITLSATRTDSAVTELGFDDNGSGDVSSTTARAGGAAAILENYDSTTPIAGGTVTLAAPTFTGSVGYGFNTLNFASTSGGSIDVGIAVSIDSGVSATSSDIVSNLSSDLVRTLTGSAGTGNATAALTLEDLTSPDSSDIDSDATISIAIPDISATTVIVPTATGVPIPVPQASEQGVLSSNATVNFLYGGSKYSIVVASATAASNTTFAQLAAQFQTALADCTKTTGGVATAHFDASSLFTVTESDGQLQINALISTANPDFTTVTFLPGLSSLGQIGLQGAFGPTTVADSLTDVLPILDSIQDGLELFGSFDLPLIKTPVNQLIDVKGDLLRKIESFRDMTVSTPDQIATALAAALSVPTSYVNVAFDSDNSAYRIDLQYETGIATTKIVDLTLADYYRLTGEEAPEGLAHVVDTGSASPLTVKIKATTVLSIGIDLTDPNDPRTFLYGHDGSDDVLMSDGSVNGTSIQLDIQASADDINFTAAVGAFGVFVRGGSASLAGPATDHAGDPAYTFDTATKQLHFATQSNGAKLTTTLGTGKYYLDPTGIEGDAGDTENYTAVLAGTAEINLPLFTPTEFINPFINHTESVYILGSGTQDVNVGGNILSIHIADLGAYSDDVLADNTIQDQIAEIYTAANGSPLPGQQAQIDALRSQQDDLATHGSVEAFAPDVEEANAGASKVTVLDLIRDPATLLDGVDILLGGVETGLRGLDSLNIPVIGPALGDAVKNVFGWRQGWLTDMKQQLRGAGEAAFQTLKQGIFDYLGPDGLNLLLKDNGIRSVDGLIPADNPDDVVLDFLDENGEKMTGMGGYGAEAVEFKLHLGQRLLDTGADISFNFDSLQPALSLGITGGLTFKLGWDMTIGFGLSLKDGFYVVTDSDPVANELELRFEAGLSGADTGFTVAAKSDSPTGYSIKDAAGAWVLGPKKGNGSQDILNVMPVHEDGTTAVPAVGETIPLPDTTCDDESAAGPASEDLDPIFWVVSMDDGSGTQVPAYIDRLGFYRPMAGSAWSTVNGSSDRNPDKMVQFNQTAPFAAFGSLFAFHLSAVDQVRTGLTPKGDADYFYDPAHASTITSAGRNNETGGVNRNNTLPTRIAGRIGVNLDDPSAASGDYVARPGPSPTGFILMDGSNPAGGEPVLDEAGVPEPVQMQSGVWYVMKPSETNPGTLEVDREITEDDSENRITFAELQEAGTKIFQFVLNAEAVLNLSITLSVGDNAAIPKITATFNLDWRTDSMKPPANPFATDEEQQRDLIPEVGFNNIRLDLGSFLTKLIKPIAVKIDGALKPIDPLINALQTKIPVISDVAGRPIRLTTLLVQFGGPYGQAIGTVIEMAILVRQLSGVMAAVPDDANVYLPIGNFWLAKIGAGPLGRPGMGTQIYYDNSEVSAPSVTQRNQSMIADPGAGLNSVTNALGGLDAMDKDSSSQPGVSGEDRGGFEIPILQDPMTIFKLIMGQDVPLVTFTLPKLNFNMDADIPLVKIFVLEVGLRLGFQVKGQLAMGYDTYGIRLFKDSHDPADFLQGFYVSDRANADGSGADVNEFELHATIALYGGVDLYLAKAGIEGGLNFNATVNLNDPNNDGKLRVMEAVDLVKYTGNPLDLADIHMDANVYARYYYWVGLKIWTPWKTYKITIAQGGKTFASMEIFSLTREGSDGPPTFAAKVTSVDQDGASYPSTLLLNMGPNASKRVSNQDPLKTQDGAERMKIWNDSPGSTTVHVQYLNYSNTETQTFTGVSRVVATGGVGDDTIDASGLNGIPVDFDGGAGNDTLKLASGSNTTQSRIAGGSGSDTITVTGGGNLRIEGGDGNDTINATGSTATLDIDPGSGNDTVTGGGTGSNNRVRFKRAFGVDTVNFDANAITNVIDMIDSTLPVTGTLGGVGSTIYAGSTNGAIFNLGAVTEILGSEGRDTFNLTNPTTRTANAGKGLIIRGGDSVDAYNVVGDDLSNVSADGITIDDGQRPSTAATLGTAVLNADCHHIKSIPVTGGGLGYSTAPDVVITDTTGHGARAVAGIDDKGRVTGIYILDGGDNYTSPIIALVDHVSRGDSLTFSSTTTGAITLDRASNGGSNDYRLADANGKAIKFVGWTTPGTVRPSNWNISETDNLTVNLPTGTLNLQAAVDVLDTFTVNARRMDQAAAITADTVKITTERGFAVNNPIQATNNGDVQLRVTGKNLSNYDASIATATATVVDGAITGFTITNQGNYYDFAPVVSIMDDRGYGARAVATIDGSGHVSGITLLDGGFGYLSTPAPRIVIAPPASLKLRADVTSSTVGSAAGTGDGRGQIALRTDLGAITTSGEVAFPSAAEIEWKHGDYRYKSSNSLDSITPTVYPTTAGGSGATAVAVLDEDGRVDHFTITSGGSGYSSSLLPTVLIEGAATATAIVDVSGHVTGFRITNPGEGYAHAPTVTILPNGFGKIVGDDANGTALNRTHIASANGSLVAIAYYGIGDPAKPIKTDVDRFVAQVQGDGYGVHVLEKDGVRIGTIDHINGVSTIDGNVSITTFAGTIHLGQPIQAMNANGQLLWQDAAQTIPIYVRDDNGNILYEGGRLQTGDGEIKLTADDIDINSFVGATGGKLVLQPVKYDAPIGLNGTRARATSLLSGGAITGTATLYSGRAYATAPLVTIPPPGERAFGVANVSAGEVKSINVTFGGKGYNATYQPIITLVGGAEDGSTPADPATAVATYDADGVVTGVTITHLGAGYYSAPTVKFSLPGVQATAEATVVDGKVTGLTFTNPGANYATPPAIEIAQPFAFGLEAEEVAYLQDGFRQITIGRDDGSHTFYAADASFNDAVQLRAPRVGGSMQVESLRVAAAPVTIVGSGHTLNLTSATPDVTGTYVEVDDNIIVHDGTDATITGTTGYVTIFGAGKGKIDGQAGSTSENLTINDVGTVTVTGAIGSTNPINNLTINSSGAGDIALQQSVTIEGDLHIVKGGNITFGGAVSVGGNLIIDDGAAVTFNGALTVGGNLTISKATTVAFAGNVNVTGNLLIGNSGDPSNIQAVTFNSTARLDASGTVEVYVSEDATFGNRVGNTRQPSSMTVRADTGDVSFSQAVNLTGHTLTIQKSRDVTFSQDVTAETLTIVDASGSTRFNRALTVGTATVTSTLLVQASNQVTISGATATFTSNEVDFAGGSGSVHYTGGGSSTLTIQPRTTSRNIAVGSPPAVIGAMDISDSDLAAIASGFALVVIGDIAAGTGAVTIGSIGTQQGAGNSYLANTTTIVGGSVTVAQAVDMAAASGTLRLLARTGNVTVNAGLNTTALERGDTVILEALSGSVAVNAPVYATTELRMLAAGAVTEGSGGYVIVPNLRVSANGAVTLLHASNAVTTVAMNAGNNAIQFREDSGYAIGTVNGLSGLSSGSADTTLTTIGGTVTQTQAITASGLALIGAGTTWTLTNASNDIVTLAASTGPVAYRDANTYTVGTVGSTVGITSSGNVGLTSGSTLTVAAPITTTGTGTVTLTSAADIVSLAAGDITSATTTTLSSVSGITAAGDVTATGAIALSATAGGINNSGALTSSGSSVGLSATGSISNGGVIQANANVSLNSSATNTTNTAGITSTTGNVLIWAAGTIDNSGAVSGAGAVIFSSGGNQTNSATVTSTGSTVNLSATGTLDNTGALSASDSVTMGATTVLTNSASVTSNTAWVLISGNSGLTNGGAVLAATAVTLGSGGNISNTSSLTSTTSTVSVTSGGSLTNSGPIQANAAVTLNGGTTVSNSGSVTSTAAGITVISGSTTTNGGVILAAGAISLSGPGLITNTATLTSSGSTVSLSGVGVDNSAAIQASGNVSLAGGASTVTNTAALTSTSAAVSVTSTGNLSTSGAINAATTVTLTTPAALTLSGGITAGDVVSISGGTIAARDSITTSNDNVSFTGPLTLSNALTVDTGAGAGNISFSSTVNGAYALDLTAGTGNITFSGVVGGVTPLASLVVHSANIVTFATDATTTGVQTITATTLRLRSNYVSNNANITYNAAVTLTGDVRLDTQGGNLTVASIDGAFNDMVIETAGGTATVTGVVTALDFVTLHDNDSQATGAVYFQGNFDATRVITVGRAYDVSFTGGTTTVNEPATFLNTGLLVLGDSATDTATFNQGITAAGSATNPSQIRLAGTLQTLDAPIVLGPVFLTANAAVDSNDGTGGDITFASTIDGAYNLRLDAGGGLIALQGKIGHVTPLAAITIDNHAGLTATDTLEAASLSQTAATGATTFNGAVTTSGSAGIDLTGLAITFNGAVTTTGGGNVTLHGTSTHFDSTLTVSGNVDATATGTATFDGATSTAGTTGVTVTAVDATFSDTLTTTNGGSVHLTLTGDANFFGAVEADANLVISATGYVNFGAFAPVTTHGATGIDIDAADVTFGGAVLADDAGAIDVHGSAVTFASTATSEGNAGITINSTSAHFMGVVEAHNAGNLSVTTTGATTADAAITTSGTTGITIHALAATFDGVVTTQNSGELTLTVGSATANAAVHTDGDILVTASTMMTFNDPVTTAGTTGITVTAVDATFADTVTTTNGGSVNLTLTGDALFSGAVETTADVIITADGDVTFGANAPLTTHGAIGIDIDATDITFGAAVLADNAGAIDVTGDDVNFASTVTTEGNAGITVNSTTAHFVGAIETHGNGNLVVITSGTSLFDAAITTNGSAGIDIHAGTATFDGIVTTLNSGELTLDVGTATANAAVSVNGDIAVNALAAITFNGTVAAAGTTGISITTAAGTFNAEVSTSNGGQVNVVNSGLLTIAAVADFTVDGAFAQTGSGAVNLAGDITTTADAVGFAGAVTLTGTVAIASANGPITFNSTLDGTQNLTITAGNGDVTFAATVGGTARLGNMTVVSAGDLTLSADFAAARFTQSEGDGVSSVRGLLDVTGTGGVTITSATVEVTSSGDIASHGQPVALTASTANITINDGATIDAGSGTITLAAPGDVTITGLVTTNATSTAVTVTSTGGAIIDAGNTATDITANSVGAVTTLSAAQGIGAANALETNLAEVNAVVGTAGNINLTDAGAIIVTSAATTDGTINLTSADTMTATIVSASSDITLLATAGDLLVGNVVTNTTVRLTSEAGKILDTGETNADGLSADTAWLIARDGMGTSGDRIDLLVQTLWAFVEDTGSTPTTGDVYLSSANPGVGAVAMNHISTGAGRIDIAHTGGDLVLPQIVDLNGPVKVVVNNGTLDAVGISAGGGSDIDLSTVGSGDVLVGSVYAVGGTTSITSAGSILEHGDDADPDIVTGALSLDAAVAIGEEANPIEIDADTLSAHADGVAAGIFLTEANDVTVLGLVSSGKIVLDAGGTISLAPTGVIRSDEHLGGGQDSVDRAILFAAPVAIAGDTQISTGGAAGDITFAGVVSGSHALTLNAGHGDITFAQNAAMAGLTVTAAHAVQFVHDLTLGAGGLLMTVEGSVTFDGDTTVGGNVMLHANNAGNTGNVTVNGDFTTTSGGDFTVDHDGLASFADGIVFSIADDTRFIGTGLVSFGSLTYHTGGDINFDNGPVNLTSNTVIDAGIGGGDVIFHDVVTGAHELVIHSSGGQVIFEQAAGTVGSPIAGLTITGAGSVQFNQPVVSTGPVNVGSSGSVVFDQPISSGGPISVTSGGSVTFTEVVQSAGLNVTTAGDLRFDEPVFITSGETNLMHAGTLYLPTGSDLTLNGAFHEVGPGAVSIGDVAITTTGDAVTFDGAIALAGDLSLATTGGAVDLNGTVNGTHSLTIAAGAGSVRIDGAIGQSISPTAISIPSSGGVTINAPVTTAINAPLTVTSTGDVTLTGTGDVSTGGAITVNTPGAFVMAVGSTLSARDGSNIVLSADSMDLAGGDHSINGTGYLVLQPLTGDRSIVIGTPHGVAAGGGAMEVSSQELVAIGSGFVGVLVGRGQEGGVDSGDAGSHSITINDATFGSDLLVRSPGAGGSVSVEGTLHATGGATITIHAAADLTVDGTIRTDSSADIDLRADYDGNSSGSVLIAQSGNASVIADGGDVRIAGYTVNLGSTLGAATVTSAGGTVDLSTDAAAGQVVVLNKDSMVSAAIDVLVGTPDDVASSPSFIRIEGTVNAGRHIRVRSVGSIEVANYRLAANGLVQVMANADLTMSYGISIAQGGAMDLLADVDGNGLGRYSDDHARRSDPSSTLFGLTFKSVKFKKGSLRAGDKGKAVVTVTNLAPTPITDYARVRIYASLDGKFDAGDALIGEYAEVLTLKGLKGKKYTLPLTLPSDLPEGDYMIVGEVLPYRLDRPAAAAPGQASDPNVIIPGITLRVKKPDLAPTVTSSFDGKTWTPGKAGKVTVNVINRGEVLAIGNATVVLYASPDGTTSGAIEVARVSAAALNLKPGKGKAFKFAVTLPGSLAAGNWKWLAVVNPDNKLAETDLSNNTSADDRSFTMRSAA